jgi:hypothetical protein
MKKIFVLLMCLIFVSLKNSVAQKIFSEGYIKYDVFKNGSVTPDGIYVITVKSGFIKQEWAMENGFNNITIYNQKTGVTLSLNMKEGVKYALEISPDELSQKNKRFQQAILNAQGDGKKIAGYATKNFKVNYSSGESVDIYATTDLVPQNTSFNTMFPGLQGIALEYVTKGSKEMIFKFVAKNVEITPIDNSIFSIPSDYKIVSKSELEKLK